jgi:response regulator RpfG family c-di-GMP phosphodiesterase
LIGNLKGAMAKKLRSQVMIYLVDDNELDLKVLTQDFELRTNYEVLPFSSGERFLKYLISNPPPKKQNVIIILNYQLNAINLDAKNGIEILKTIREINRDYEVIMISGHVDREIVTNALHFGAVNFVRKNENIFMRLQNHITWIISQAELRKKRNEAIYMMVTFAGIVLFIAGLFIVAGLYFPDIFDI